MPSFPAHVWRTYDIRGKTPHEITPLLARRLGGALGSLLRERGAATAVAGRDARVGGRDLQLALMEGLAEAGIVTYDIGQVPTPVMYFAVSGLGYDAGVNVTASHNPAGYNGFKIRVGDEALFGPDVQLLRERAGSDASFSAPGGLVKARDVQPDYIEQVRGDCRLPDRPLRVVIDAGNGVAGPLAVRLFSRMGVEVVPLYCDPDGTFPNHPANPTEAENLRDLQRVVAEVGADLGIGLDGDGDRVGAVAPDGRVFFGDRMMALFAQGILAHGPGAVVADVKCSLALQEVVEAAGGTFTLAPTGYPWIQRKMAELGAPLGGELSGHLCFADRYYGYDDGLYAASRLLELLEDLPARLAALPAYPAIPELRLHTGEAEKWLVPDLLRERLAGFAVLDIDGLRFSDARGWGLVRVSNTEPCLTVRAEARTRGELAALVGKMIADLEAMPVPIDLAPLRAAAAGLG